MSTSVYTLNKGINRSIEFKGLKAQYIWWLGGGLVCILILFALMYISGINSWFCVVFAMATGSGLIIWIYQLSNTYGVHGMMKKIAQKRVPRVIVFRTRKMFMHLQVFPESPKNQDSQLSLLK